MRNIARLRAVLVAVLGLVLAVGGGVAIGASTAQAATSLTRDEALNWARAQIGKSIEADGCAPGSACYAQCVDLIKAYYQALGVSAVRGNGSDYVSNALPSGWQRIRNSATFVPQPGDIAVFTGGYNGWGHVGIVETANINNYVGIDQNWSGQYVQRVSPHPYNFAALGYNVYFWGVIRPDFKSPSQPQPPAPPAAVGNDGRQIMNVATARCIDSDAYRTADGTKLQLWDCHRGGNQQWLYKDNKSLRMYANYDKCLDVSNGRQATGTQVWLFQCNGTDAQKWTLRDDGTIRSTGGLCLEPREGSANGTILQLGTCGTSDRQKWLGPATKRDGNTMVNVASSKCLDVNSGDTHRGAAIEAYGCHGGANQTFSYLNSALRVYHFGCLDFGSGTPTDGTIVRLRECNGSTSQRLARYLSGTIKSPNGLCLEQRANTATVVLAKCDGSTKQKWVGPSIAVGQFSYSGEARVGKSVTMSPTLVYPGSAKSSYQWRAGTTTISGATTATLGVRPEYFNQQLSVVVTIAATGLPTTTRTLRIGSPVAAGTLQTSSRPRIKGKARVGKTLRVSGGTWSPQASTSIRWYVGKRHIKSLDGRSKLKVRRSYAGKQIRVKVTGKRTGYQTRTLTSARTAKVRR